MGSPYPDPQRGYPFDDFTWAFNYAKQEVRDREELHDVKSCRIDADDAAGARVTHAQRVIAVAAADVQNLAALKRIDSVLEAIPLEVAAPLAVDGYPVEHERALSPRVQR